MHRLRRTLALITLTATGLVGVAVPAEAASGSLTVTTLDRAGTATTTTIRITNVATFRQYSFRTGSRHALPNGIYGVEAVISDGTTQTLGAKVVTVSGHNVALTFDARRGKKLTITPSIASPGFYAYEADACVNGGDATGLAEFDGIDNYVIPVKGARISFTFVAEWANSVNGPFYAVDRKIRDGIPSNPTFSYAHASFARLLLTVLRGRVPNPLTNVMMVPYPASPCAADPEGWGQFSAPRTVTEYLSPGRWGSQISYDDFKAFTQGPELTVRAGVTYRETVRLKPPA